MASQAATVLGEAPNAQQIVEKYMDEANKVNNMLAWTFFNHVYEGIVPGTRLSGGGAGLLHSTLQEVAAGNHDKVLKDRQKMLQWAMVISTWANSASLS